MSKREGQHDYLLRVPEASWVDFVELVGTLRPRRSVNQQIVDLIERFVVESALRLGVRVRKRPGRQGGG
jgi:hypothetical protein